MPELKRLSIEEFKNSNKIPLVVVLDNVRSMNNIGSAFRTSDAFRIEKIILCGISARPPHREITKTALGADESVGWEYHEKIEDALKQLRDQGFTIVGVEQTDKSIMLEEFPIDKNGKYALVFGNEAFGLSDEALPHLDYSIEIPQFGTKHSLNVSVSLGIAIWDFFKVMRSGF